MSFPTRTVFLATLVFGAASITAKSDVQVPSLFSDHMVLLKSAKVPVWGTASPGENITVTVDKAKATATAGADGKWRADLALQDEGQGPFTMAIQGTTTITISDVVVGEVWLASGQSNMTFMLSQSADAAAEAAQSANPMLREFDVKGALSAKLLDQCEGKWQVASPQTSPTFSAVGYYFGKTLQNQLQVPVGIIHSSYGGSSTEAWIDAAGFESDPDLKAAKDLMYGSAASYPDRSKDYAAQIQAWEKTTGREDHPNPDIASFAAPGIPLDSWKALSLPGLPSKAGLPDSGAFWIRRTVTIPQSIVGHYVSLHLGDLHGFDTVYWNGKQVGQTTSERSTSMNDSIKDSNNRRYDVGGHDLAAGETTLAIRIFNPGPAEEVAPISIDFAGGKVDLHGDWFAKSESELPPVAATAPAFPSRPLMPPNGRGLPTMLFNAMIHPLVPYAIRGVVWYQGESNTGRAAQARVTLPILIKDWRSVWQDDQLPFYFCQLPSFGGKVPQPQESGWAEYREAQTQALSLPHTGQAVLIDLGEANEIHYRNKKDVGERLGSVVLAGTYDKSIPASGPVYQSMTVDGDKVRVNFTHTDGGLVARPLPATYQPRTIDPLTLPLVRNSPGGEVEGFAICGDDHKWVWAEAKIDGVTVLVSSPQVPHPVAIRYAWADNPTCNLYNGAGLPAWPFRTDDFPAVTFGRRYGF